MFLTAFAVFSIPSITAVAPASVLFTDLKVLTDMFVDCDTIIVSEGGVTHNIHQVSQPVKVFNDWQVFKNLTSHSYMYGKNDPFQERVQLYMKSKLDFLRKDLKGLNCRAQILLLYQPWLLDTVLYVRDVSGFRLEESTYRYTVIIHRDHYKLKQKIFVWDRRSASPSTLPHYYHVTIGCYHQQGSESPIKVRYSGWRTCTIRTFKKTCLSCRGNDVLEFTCNQSPQKECPRAIGQDSQWDGSITANERHLAVVHHNQYVRLHRLRLAIWIPIVKSFRVRINAVQRKFGRHAVLTRLGELVFPEEIFFYALMTHHKNMSVQTREYHGTPIEAGEIIAGPGYPTHEAHGNAMHTLPVDTEKISFMTCSNLTFLPHTDIFFAPFDGATWMWTLTSVIAVSVAMVMTLKGMKLFPALCLTLYTMVRLLVDNQQGIRKDLVRSGKVMASLTFLMALTTIILSTGYKGLLTSDFARDPTLIGTPTFEQVLASNWTVSRHTSLTFAKTKEFSLKVQFLNCIRVDRNLHTWQKWADKAQQYSSVTFTETALKEYELVSKALSKLVKTQAQLHTSMDEKEISAVFGECHCNGSYWLFETGPPWQPRFPRECQNLPGHQKFFLSKEHIAKLSIAWSSAGMRPGPLFRSIHRAVEAGLYKWLIKIRSIARSDVYVEGDVMMRVLTKEPKPLSMKTAVISSTFKLFLGLSALTVGVLVVEMMWIRKKRIYFALWAWIAKCQRCRLWQEVFGSKIESPVPVTQDEDNIMQANEDGAVDTTPRTAKCVHEVYHT